MYHKPERVPVVQRVLTNAPFLWLFKPPIVPIVCGVQVQWERAYRLEQVGARLEEIVPAIPLPLDCQGADVPMAPGDHVAALGQEADQRQVLIPAQQQNSPSLPERRL